MKIIHQTTSKLNFIKNLLIAFCISFGIIIYVLGFDFLDNGQLDIQLHNNIFLIPKYVVSIGLFLNVFIVLLINLYVFNLSINKYLMGLFGVLSLVFLFNIVHMKNDLQMLDSFLQANMFLFSENKENVKEHLFLQDKIELIIMIEILLFGLSTINSITSLYRKLNKNKRS
ncbi:hypothetical protein AVL50_03320 [Flammeovirga sp. SJP92]|nr:hypothetical protein AVL50_03320 [Flammeovirga sp. SJP92]